MWGFSGKERLPKKERELEARYKRIDKANQKDSGKTLTTVVALAAGVAAAASEPGQEVGSAVMKSLDEVVNGRHLLVDLPPQPLQVDVPPSGVESGAHVAKLETGDTPMAGGGK